MRWRWLLLHLTRLYVAVVVTAVLGLLVWQLAENGSL